MKTYNEAHLIAAFVQGAKWWEYHKEKATMWQSDQNLALFEAGRMLRNGTLGLYSDQENYERRFKKDNPETLQRDHK